MAAKEHAITIIGCGPGSPDYVTPAARAAAQQADCLLGADRLLKLFPESSAEKLSIGSSMQEILDSIALRVERQKVGVLVSGDPGLYSLSKLVLERFGRSMCQIIPGISSVQVAFAAIGLDWEGARIVSAHKENPSLDPSWAQEEKIAVLGGRTESVQWLAEQLLPLLPEPVIFLCENLTLEDESIREVRSDELTNEAMSTRVVMLIVNRRLLLE